MAPGTSGVRERLVLHGDEPPLVALRAQGELQDAVGVVVVDLAVGDRVHNRVVALAPCAHHELPDAPLRVCPPLGILRGETLVVVVVTVENHVGTRGVEGFPKRLHLRDAGTVIPRGEQWVVELDKRTRLLVVGGGILLKPADLGRGIAAATDFLAVAVEGDHVLGP